MKKLISLLLALLAPLALLAQQKYTVKGRLGKVGPSGKIYLAYRDYDQDKVDSTDVVDGSFEFKGKVQDVTFAELIMNYHHAGLAKRYRTDRSNTYYNFYLVSGTTLINSADSLINSKITGTKVNEAGILYDSLLNGVRRQKQMAISAFFKSDKSTASIAVYRAKMLMLANQDDSLSFQFITQRPDNYMSLIILGHVAGFKPEPAKIQPVFNCLSPQLRQTAAGKRLEALITSVKSTSIGNTALDFAMNDPQGKKIRLSDLRGKYVLLDFWASWCGPCRKENPNLVRVYQEFKNKNFAVLSVSLDSKKEAWLKAIQDDQLTWMHVSDLKYWNNEAAVKYGINSVPSNFLIDPEGKIIGKNLLNAGLEMKLKEVLN